MAHSNSSLNCFTNCMAKYKYSYIDHLPPDVPPSLHLTFGAMAHEVLEKAGRLRDEARDGVINTSEYLSIIPSEILYNDLKEYFGITNWQKYFTPVIKETAAYEKQLIDELAEVSGSYQDIVIEREVKLQLPTSAIPVQTIEPLVGVIDLLIHNKKYAFIIDYKFSASHKTQDNFDLDSQLQIYAELVRFNYSIDCNNIKIGYIDIPKIEFGKPTVLSNGTLSRAKNQNISQELYEAAVTAVHGDDPVYNCKPGGYYYNIWCEFANNKAAYLTTQWVDIDTITNVLNDVFQTIELLTAIHDHRLPYIKKYDSYSCKSCEYRMTCKPWSPV